MALTGAGELSEVDMVVFHSCIGLVAHMRACLRQGGFSQVATIREKSRVGGGDQAVNEVNSLVTVTVASGTAGFVKSCSTSGAL